MKKAFAVLLLSIIYSIAILVSVVTKKWLRSKHKHNRIIVNGTFHNPNWFHAHITPLIESGYGEVILVCDEPIAELKNLTYRCPPQWANKVFSRAGAKGIWTFIQGIKTPADIYIGYHIFPSAITALICARLLGATSVYQITSGPLELEGGGWHAENKLLVALGQPSRIVERLALRVLGEFELAIVRGSRAKAYIQNNGFKNRVEIVTGSVDVDIPIAENKEIDIILVGRLSEYKRPDRFIEVVQQVVSKIPDCHVAIVGEGPDRSSLENQVQEQHLTKNVHFLGQRKDVPDLVANSKIFVLTSRWEGVSIAMLEAMAMKAVPVVSDVGDLADFAINSKTGFVVQEDDIASYASHITNLLSDARQRSEMACAARNLVVEKCSRVVLAKRWLTIFNNLVGNKN